MALPSTYVAPKDADELAKRKALDAKIKLFATTDQSMGYALPEQTAKELSEEGAGIGLSENQVRNKFNQYSGVDQKPAPIQSSLTPSTPLLDRYDALQKSQGPSNVLSQKRSLESDTGRAMRMARKLQRGGFGRAAEQIALTGGETGLKEPTLKSQDYASGMKSKNDASLAASQTFQTGMEEEAKLRRDLLKAQLEAFKSSPPTQERLGPYMVNPKF